MKFTDIIAYFIIILSLILTFLPVYLLIVTSFKNFTEAFSYPPTLVPKEPTLSSYVSVFAKWNFTSYAINSIVITTLSVAMSILLGVPMAYSLSRFKFGKNLNDFLAFFILSIRMIPPIVGIIPLFIVFKILGLNDTFQGLILAYTSFNLPFTVWILRGFFLELPKEIEEAALIDGATYFNILRKIVVPLSFPAIITTATLSLIQSWNEFIFAVFLTSQERKTIPILIASFIGDQQYFWNELTAASVIALIPVFILVLLVQKQLIRGLTFGAVKG